MSKNDVSTVYVDASSYPLRKRRKQVTRNTCVTSPAFIPVNSSHKNVIITPTPSLTMVITPTIHPSLALGGNAIFGSHAKTQVMIDSTSGNDSILFLKLCEVEVMLAMVTSEQARQQALIQSLFTRTLVSGKVRICMSVDDVIGVVSKVDITNGKIFIAYGELIATRDKMMSRTHA